MKIPLLKFRDLCKDYTIAVRPLSLTFEKKNKEVYVEFFDGGQKIKMFEYRLNNRHHRPVKHGPSNCIWFYNGQIKNVEFFQSGRLSMPTAKDPARYVWLEDGRLEYVAYCEKLYGYYEVAINISDRISNL